MHTNSLRSTLLRASTLAALAVTLSTATRADEVFAKPPTAGGGINASAWTTPDGSDSDMYSWDEFTLAETQTITEVRWRGGYKFNGLYGKATDFRISFFDSIAGGFQPVITALPEHESQETVIATFHTQNNAGESFAGSSGGVTMYDYHFTLPTPVTLQGGVKYWFRVVAGQPGYPDWGMATGGTGSHFVYNQGAHMFQNWPHDLAFALHARWTDLGNGLAGVAGVPTLKGSGTLAPGSSSTIVLEKAAPLAPTWIVAGTSDVYLPLAGGVLVPSPQVIASGLTDASGSSSLTFDAGPNLPPNFRLVMQVWTLDPLAVEWLSASNGLSGVH